MIFGQFSERSFPFDPGELVPFQPDQPNLSPREWLTGFHAVLKHQLPAGPLALLTQDLLTTDGRPVDVFAHFGIKPDGLAGLRQNFHGLAHTAQAAGASSEEEQPTPPWPGFEDIRLPIGHGVEVCGRLGWARSSDGHPRDADCIVILPGILGDNNVLRTRDLAAALVSCGLHAMALELRGHGETWRARPDLFYNFGALEAVDLLAVSRWLESQPHIRRTGLVGFCWGANHALLAAFMDTRPKDHPSLTPALVEKQGTVPDYQHFRAGVIAFSPVLRFEELLAELKTPWSRFRHPVLSGMQASIRSRMVRRGYPNPSGSLLDLIHAEFARSPLSYADGVKDAIRMLRFLPHEGLPDGDKLRDIRIPSLVVHAANDPMAKAQDIADLAARVANPNFAALILPGGGHVGFAAYAKAYYFNLILNFFAPGAM